MITCVLKWKKKIKLTRKCMNVCSLKHFSHAILFPHIRLNYLCMFYNWLAVVVRKQIPQKCRTNLVTSSTSLSKDEDSTTPAFLPPTSQSKDEGSTTTKSDTCQPPDDESTDSAATGIYDKLLNLQFPASGLTRKFKQQALDLSNSCSQKAICWSRY